MATHTLTGELVLRESYSATDQAIKTVPAANTSFEIELSADDGDSVQVRGISPDLTKKALTNADTGVIIAATSCVGMKSFQVYCKTTSTLVGPQVITVEVSPHATDDVWIATTATVTPSGTNNVVVASSVVSALAKRVRVSIAAAITSGTADVYLMVQGN